MGHLIDSEFTKISFLAEATKLEPANKTDLKWEPDEILNEFKHGEGVCSIVKFGIYII